MLDDQIIRRVLEIKSAQIPKNITEVDKQAAKTESVSFRAMRKARKKNRLRQNTEKALSHKKELLSSVPPPLYSGPTPETVAKLKPDPLIVFRNKNILNGQQIWAFQCIRRAVRIITDGTHLRTSCLTDTRLAAYRDNLLSDSEYDLWIQEEYHDWIDRMTAEQRPIGPVLDIIIEELSLRATDCKWRRRKGWARQHLPAALDLYGICASSDNRDK